VGKNIPNSAGGNESEVVRQMAFGRLSEGTNSDSKKEGAEKKEAERGGKKVTY